MKKNTLLILLIISIELYSSTPWNYIHFSSPNEDNLIFVRCIDSFNTNLNLLYRTENGTVSTIMELVDLQNHVKEASINAPDFLNITKIGFRAIHEESSVPVKLNPIKLDNNAILSQENLTWVTDEPIGNIPFSENFLDIKKLFVSYDDEQLYFGIENNGGGFPVSSAPWGPFYSYMALITSQNSNESLYGLLYTINQTAIIQPGLYKINGTGINDLEFIAEINSYIDTINNLLVLSCLWSDLNNQDDFSNWFYQENSSFNFLATTSKITLSNGMQEADVSQVSTIYISDLEISNQYNSLPTLSDFSLSSDFKPTINYFDTEGHFPLISYLLINNIEFLELYPMNYNFLESVTFKTRESNNLLTNNTWETIKFVFSDNQIDFVEQTYNNQTSIDSFIYPDKSIFQVYPNPVKNTTKIMFHLDNTQPVELSVYNIKGQKVQTINNNLFSKGLNEVQFQIDNQKIISSGIYFLKLKKMNETKMKKIVFIK